MTGWRRFVGPGDLVFQIGASAAREVTVASLLGLGARVVVVEADPERVRALRVRFRDAANLTVVERGVANRPGRLAMAAPGGAAIEITTLDLLVRELGSPRYCRVDVG